MWSTITENHSCLPENWSWKICSYTDNYLLHKNIHIYLHWQEEEQIFLDILFTSEKTPTALPCFLLKKEERRAYVQTHFMKAALHCYQNKTRTLQEKERPLSLTNRDAKSSTILLSATLIQQPIRRITQHDPVGFIPRMQGWLHIGTSTSGIHHLNKIKDKNPRVITIDAQKSLDKIQYAFMIKTLNHLGVEGTYFNKTKVWKAHNWHYTQWFISCV